MLSGSPALYSIWANDQVYAQVTLPSAPKRKHSSVQRSSVPEGTLLFRRFQLLPACPSDSSSIRMKTSMEH